MYNDHVMMPTTQSDSFPLYKSVDLVKFEAVNNTVTLKDCTEKGNLMMSLAFFIKTDEGYIMTTESRIGSVVHCRYIPKNDDGKKIVMLGTNIGITCVGEQNINNVPWYEYVELLYNNSNSTIHFISKLKALVASLAKCGQSTQFLIVFAGDQAGIYSNVYDENIYFFDEKSSYFSQGDTYYLSPHIFLNHQIGQCRTITDGLSVVKDLQKRSYETAVYLEQEHGVFRTINNDWKILVLPFGDEGYFL